ncbi:MAG: type IV toxin-antitoxin system AbiEi family antitoxin [Candidatus Methylomirabilia bacterium]
MLNDKQIGRLVVQRLRELFPKARAWEETSDERIGSQATDVVVKFRMGEYDHTLVLEVTGLGQPRQIRAAVTRLNEIHRELPGAYPVAVSVYISPESAAILRRNGLGYLDLSGNCYLALENILIEKEGKPNVHPSTRPLKSLFASRATRVVRTLLVSPYQAWRLEALAQAAGVSLGHAHNVVKRLEELSWVDRGEQQRIRLAKPAELLEAWREAYTYRQNALAAYFSAERITRKLMVEIARAAQAQGRRYAFTLHSGAALVAPNIRVPEIHCYLEGESESLGRSLGLRPGEGEGNVHLLAPYDQGVFHAPLEKGGLSLVCLPQLYVDLYHYERRGKEQAEYLRREAIGY